MAKAKRLTIGDVVRDGEYVADWACDVGVDGWCDSNGSREFIYVYDGKEYSVICDWDGNARWPNRLARPMDTDE